MVLEGFPNFRVFENSFLNGPILTPKLYQKALKIMQKAFLKTNCFLMSIFHQFLIDSGPPNHPKMTKDQDGKINRNIDKPK